MVAVAFYVTFNEEGKQSDELSSFRLCFLLLTLNTKARYIKA